jgi:uncharacterized protein YqgQ
MTRKQLLACKLLEQLLDNMYQMGLLKKDDYTRHKEVIFLFKSSDRKVAGSQDAKTF